MKKSISFHVYKGDKYYVAEGMGVPIVTQGKTLDILQKNMAEAVQVFLYRADSRQLGIIKNPAVLFSGELDIAHA
ncbi:MAG: type II toxin-antitoxin system HicB family antitoxin [Patescibacteria group bacterium]